MADGYFIISRIHVWLTRWKRCRGFGIQSPNDFAFVRDVINEHHPYYSYSELSKKHPSMDALRRKKYELYLRIANFRQPTSMIDMMEDGADSDDNQVACHDYIHAGCTRCQISFCRDDTLQRHTAADIIRCRTDEVLALTIGGKLSQGTVLLVEPSHRRSLKSRAWKRLVDKIPYGVCFDLYYCGIILFDKKRYKQNYIINF